MFCYLLVLVVPEKVLVCLLSGPPAFCDRLLVSCGADACASKPGETRAGASESLPALSRVFQAYNTKARLLEEPYCLDCRSRCAGFRVLGPWATLADAGWA